MEKMTLLEMTQEILSAMSGDEVNSISDTVESLQVANEIRNTYRELYSNRDITEHEGLVTLTPSGEASNPHVMTIPDTVLNIKWVRYRNHRANGTQFDLLQYLKPEEFIERLISNNMSLTSDYLDVPILTTSPVEYPIQTNKAPTYYTMLDNDNVIVFDSFDLDYESNLTASNALVWGVMAQPFTLSDDFIPSIDSHLFPHLLAEAKSACFINIKEVSNSKEEQRARRQLVRSQTRIPRLQDQRESVFDADYSRKR